MKVSALFISFLLLCTVLFAQEEVTNKKGQKIILLEDGTWKYADSSAAILSHASKISGLEIPKYSSGDIIVKHLGYTLSYNETHEQANWVSYELTKAETAKAFERSDKFKPDPEVKTGSATDADYSGSGYDRGHLAPAADMGWSSTAMAESFYYSNMSPQLPGFNRGIWKKLEELVRDWAVENEALNIVTGPVLTPDLPTVGPNRVSIPKYYFKVILDYTEPGLKGIGFILPNASSSFPLQNYSVTIDSVEKLTGIDFFPLLPKAQAITIESNNCLKCWSWPESRSSLESQGNMSSGSHQCNGIAQAGNRCKQMTYSPNGKCYQHGGD